MSNDPCMDSLGYPFGDVRYITRRTPSDPRTGCSFIVCHILTFLELRLGDLVSALGWEICWMEYIWKNPLVLYLGPRRLQLGCSFHFECLLFYCPHLLLFFALSITLGKTARFDSNKVSHSLAKWHNARRPGVAVGLSFRGNVLVDLRAGWALCGRGCILSMDLGWPGADMNSTKQAVVTTTRDKVSL